MVVGGISQFLLNVSVQNQQLLILEKARDFVQENWTCNTSKAKNDTWLFSAKYL